MECIICDKHKDLQASVGGAIATRNGMTVSHYPIIDNQPAIKGHLLIEPIRHVTEASELTEDEAMAMGLLIRNSIVLLKSKLGAEHAYVFRINDKVPHFHVHVVPRFPNTPAEFWGHKITEWNGATKLGLEQIQTLSSQLSHLEDKL
jgi:histidine triad (HIT) family protein